MLRNPVLDYFATLRFLNRECYCRESSVAARHRNLKQDADPRQQATRQRVHHDSKAMRNNAEPSEGVIEGINDRYISLRMFYIATTHFTIVSKCIL